MPFVHSTRLPHVLPPSAYHDEAHYRLEVERLLLPAWHLVGSKAELSRPGDFLTVELLGRPIQVRNFDGELRALSNVCAHRHALIASERCGRSSTMRCQYHGWEYERSGRTRRIPQAKCFAPIDRQALRLPSYAIATCGQLVFVSLADDPAPLAEQLGDLHATCETRFGAGWRPSLRWERELAVNWKIPIENSLEAYHVPAVHPLTFKADPGEQRSEHRLEARWTSFTTRLPFHPHSRSDAVLQRVEGWFVRAMGATPTANYCQCHCFPNLLFSFTDTVSLCQAVIPMGPTTARSVLRQFGRAPAAGQPWRRLLGMGWGKFAAAITRQIQSEDMRLYSAIQQGLLHSRVPGILGRCEERIHAFQAYVARACHEADAARETCDPVGIEN
ncbi:MAG TPA: SRPBCC family protein [Pirellulales bacterium]|nr:SRPBCC family protein [Pirellulales bacterium]